MTKHGPWTHIPKYSLTSGVNITQVNQHDFEKILLLHRGITGLYIEKMWIKKYTMGVTYLQIAHFFVVAVISIAWKSDLSQHVFVLFSWHPCCPLSTSSPLYCSLYGQKWEISRDYSPSLSAVDHLGLLPRWHFIELDQEHKMLWLTHPAPPHYFIICVMLNISPLLYLWSWDNMNINCLSSSFYAIIVTCHCLLPLTEKLGEKLNLFCG